MASPASVERLAVLHYAGGETQAHRWVTYGVLDPARVHARRHAWAAGDVADAGIARSLLDLGVDILTVGYITTVWRAAGRPGGYVGVSAGGWPRLWETPDAAAAALAEGPIVVTATPDWKDPDRDSP